MVEDKNERKIEVESRRAGYDAHEANLRPIIIIGVVSIILLIVSVVLVDQLFISTKERLVEEVVLSPESTALREQRAREDEVLGSYRVIDAGKGIYQIPIERAMELLADEAYKNQQKNTREQ